MNTKSIIRLLVVLLLAFITQSGFASAQVMSVDNSIRTNMYAIRNIHEVCLVQNDSRSTFNSSYGGIGTGIVNSAQNDYSIRISSYTLFQSNCPDIILHEIDPSDLIPHASAASFAAELDEDSDNLGAYKDAKDGSILILESTN